MTLKEIFLSGSGALVVILTLIQISPIKVDPFGALARWIGRALNGDVLKKLDKMESAKQKHVSGWTSISILTMSAMRTLIVCRFFGSIESCCRRLPIPRKTLSKHFRKSTSMNTIVRITRNMKIIGRCWRLQISSVPIWSGRKARWGMRICRPIN